jgi:hypothetical protein
MADTDRQDEGIEGADRDREAAEELVEKAKAEGLDLVGPDGVLTGLKLEAGLEAELSEHLGYDKHAPEGRDGGNSRNGTRAKTVLTEVGPVPLDSPGAMINTRPNSTGSRAYSAFMGTATPKSTPLLF